MSDPLPAPDTRLPDPPHPDPARPGWVRRFIVDYNPFFLLSAMSMLAGSLALTNSLSWSPVRLERILLLTLAINVYELLLVALGLFLIVRRGARRDGSILLILEAFFLVDVAFLNAELFAISPWVGLAANAVVFVLALLKLGAIFHILRVPLASPLVGMIFVELLALFALPGLLKMEATLSGGRLTPLVMYLAWWMVFTVGVFTIGSLRTHATGGRLTWFAPLVAVLGCISLIAHAGTSQWVYDLRYWGANLAPMLALAAFVLLSGRRARAAGFLLAVAALFAARSTESSLNLALLGRAVAPVEITLIATYLVIAWTLLRQLFLPLCGAGAAAVLLALFGPSLATVRGLAYLAIDRVLGVADMLRPKTLAHWGFVGVVMSFVFLILGAIVSLRREPPASNQQA